MCAAIRRATNPVVAAFVGGRNHATRPFTHTMYTRMNRLRDLFDDFPPSESAGDFFEIESFYDYFAVSRDTAAAVEHRLDAQPPPRWVAFTDLFGVRHRIMAGHIYRISECTAAQRAVRRAFWRTMKAEDKRDRRPWEDND